MSFSIGAIEFPPVVAKGVVTPVDMGTDINDQVVKNIAVLLQSLDADGDASNGITIPSAAVTAAVQTVNFDQSYASFASEVLPVVQHTDSGKTVVTESAAVAHLEESIENSNAETLVGTWYVQGEDYKYVLFVLDGERYAALDFSEGDGAALELGSYAWNQDTGVVTVTNVERTDSDLDAHPPMANGNTLELEGNTLTLVDGNDTFVATRLVASEESPLRGGWSIEDEAFFAFTDTHYFMGQSSEPDENGQPGVEMGTYTYNAETKAITYATLVDNNLQWGISHPCAIRNRDNPNPNPNYEISNYFACGLEDGPINQTFEVTGDTLTFISEADTIANNGDQEEVMFERVEGLPDGDIHLKLQLTLTLTEYSQGQRYEPEGGTMQCDLDNPREIGEAEVLNESWVLGDLASWVSTVPAIYNLESKKINFALHDGVKPVPGHPGFYEEFWEELDATYNPGENNVITGTYTERYDLTWDRGPSDVSTCVATYSVIGVLR
ncbi:MAG TPA: hypothetical protein VL995_02905 [Cellvibrio sp.]|nr:hypothetical protein [Cellvibrio sp.]